MTNQELKIAVLDVIDTIIHEPVVNAEDVKQTIEQLFEEAGLWQRSPAGSPPSQNFAG